MSNYITIIGLTAAILTTIAQLPQAIKTFKTKKARDISLGMYVLLVVGVFLWLVYGLIIKDAPVIFANAITLILVSTILGFKIKYN